MMQAPMTPLENPIDVGECTAGELAELRARGDVAKDLESRLTEGRAEVDRLTRLSTLVANEQMGFVQRIFNRLGLDPRDAHRISTDTGQITVVAKAATPIPAMTVVPDQSDPDPGAPEAPAEPAEAPIELDHSGE